MPCRCPERKRGGYANRGYRHLFVENYTAVFRIDEAKKMVIVVTVRYSPSEF
ncbi:type II toxin-antitoxin system RelE/ParE family toxin [Blautia hydrogenotrophica]|uniref:type II toxin-antitoxin system RelE/ParE family toxin n=1 Tax=Blautia hydrogenotrophica TaxID=53443 RepID=UPI000B241DF5|nr:type II toxin-antitoxin system RelE/ParE family toxin [Blautia hydrogenotrophica]